MGGRLPATAAAAAAGSTMKSGLLVSFKKDGKDILALVKEPDGKKNW
jgi:hypothetical protein